MLPNEDLFQFLWRKRAFGSEDLRTTDGEEVAVLHPGLHNKDSGPDFLNSRIRIGDLEWVGNVELHLKSSDWNAHGHQNDPAYDNVILHVVEEDDRPVLDPKGNRLKTLVLGDRIDRSSIERYTALMSALDDIPCHRSIGKVERIKVYQWIDRMLVQRLQRKAKGIHEMVQTLNGDVQTAFFVFLAKSYGAKVNSTPFERLARSIPIKTLIVHRKDRAQVEALLYGMSGLLGGEHQDEYPKALQKEFSFLRSKYGLNPMNNVEWKWHRIRPSGFPTLRLSQLAGLISSIDGPLIGLLEIEDHELILEDLRVNGHEYWTCHSNFGSPSGTMSASMGKSAANTILINTIIPFLFYIGNERNRPELKDRALLFLERLSAEDNRIIRRWKELGVIPKNCGDSQGLIELYNLECQHKNCLFCGIGGEVIGRAEHRS